VWPESCRTGCDRLRMPPNSKLAAQVIRRRTGSRPAVRCFAPRSTRTSCRTCAPPQWRLAARQRALQRAQRPALNGHSTWIAQWSRPIDVIRRGLVWINTLYERFYPGRLASPAPAG
jgi:hypothetical protein